MADFGRSTLLLAVALAWLGVGTATGCGDDETSAGGGAASGGTGVGGDGLTAGGDVGGEGAAGGAHPAGANEPPVAHGETYYGATGQPVALGSLLANDVDPDGDPLEVVELAAPAHGSLEGTGQSLEYRPAPDFVGEELIAYRIADGHGGEDTAEVAIYIAAHQYYVSPSGDDAAAGTSPTAPWRTLERANAAFCAGTIAAGDQLLFERGATYRGTLSNCSRLGAAGRPIVVGAYGQGAAPTISAGLEVTGWTAHGGGLWRASVEAPVADLFWNGVRQIPARLPDGDTFTSEPSTPGEPTRLNADELTGAAGAYVGANVRMRTVNWAFETKRVVGSEPGRLELESAFQYDVTDGGWGFFLTDHLSFLDAPGEWFYDEAASTLYFWPPGDAEPSSGLVEVSHAERAIALYNGEGVASHIVVDGLAARHATDTAVSVSYLNGHVTLRRLEIGDSFAGLRVFADDVALLESLVTRTLDEGMRLVGARNRAERNRFVEVAVVAGYGTPRWGYLGAHVEGTDSVARHNELDGVGYIGLTAGGDGVLIEENLVRRTNLLLNDGGSIAFDHCDGLTVRRNVVLDAVGSLEGVSPDAGPWKSPYRRIVFGAYFGNTSIKRTTVEGNVLLDHTAGVYVDHTAESMGNAVRDNIAVGHDEAQIYFSDQSVASCIPAYDDVLSGNLLVPTAPEAETLYLLDVKCTTPVGWGSFDLNRYFSPYSDEVVVRVVLPAPAESGRYTLAAWQAQSGQDTGSSSTPPGLELEPTVQPAVFYNASRGIRTIAPEGAWRDVDGSDVDGVIELAPFTAVVLWPR